MKTTPVIPHAVTWAQIFRFSSKMDRGRPQVFVRYVSRNLFRVVFFPIDWFHKIIERKKRPIKRCKVEEMQHEQRDVQFLFFLSLTHCYRHGDRIAPY